MQLIFNSYKQIFNYICTELLRKSLFTGLLAKLSRIDYLQANLACFISSKKGYVSSEEYLYYLIFVHVIKIYTFWRIYFLLSMVEYNQFRYISLVCKRFCLSQPILHEVVGLIFVYVLLVCYFHLLQR